MNHGCSDFRRTRLSRRKLLSAGGMGLLGLSLPGLLRLRDAAANPSAESAPATARSVILLYQFGGASHIDSFDTKPEAPAEIRGEFKTIPTAVPSLRICEHLPRLARLADKYALVRSLHHTMGSHNSAAYYNITGHAPSSNQLLLRDSPELYPAYGSVVSRFKPPTAGVPSFAALPYVIADGIPCPGQHASFLGKAHDPFLIRQDPNAADFKLPELSLPAETPLERLEDRRRLLAAVDEQTARMDYAAAARGVDAYHARAFDMLRSPAVRKAFDIAAEPAKTRDRYGRTPYGQSCLLARRLVEAGVSFINVYFSASIGIGMGAGGWDTHRNNFGDLKGRLLPQTDHTVSALLEDLEGRGLLKSTMVVWIGDFGRTPKIGDQTPDGRGHWPPCYTALLAGGGVRGGAVYGSSDRSAAYPATNPTTPDDIGATMFAALGIRPDAEVRDLLNRPLPISAGKPITAIMS
jgi:hypothetical protein